ncbi:FAD:protein FMN transferase [Entomohabitans teleogrylli]|uniref:FAD:protein FMN transferase n=1 Tax=Entomohabitans teleogrylli TaxID=1384589 RepID=UPI00073D7AA5|nr:FAD:protein FMN transferase [Entomohabitans teleogrylli]
MSKISTDLIKYALSGPTMGTRWSALFYAPAGYDSGPVQTALQQAVDNINEQMSTRNPYSDLMWLNHLPAGESLIVPDDIIRVLQSGLAIGQASGGAFDIGMGDAVRAWGFGTESAEVENIRKAMAARRQPAHELLALKGNIVHKRGAIVLDLNGIAKGYGADRLMETLAAFGIESGLVGIDGELRAQGLRPDNQAWTIAIEAPDPNCRATHSILTLQDAAVATSGDYRHWVNVQGYRLSHTMDPQRGAPLVSPPASVTVVAPTCTEADAWATALMVAGPETGERLARQQGLSALFLMRDNAGKIASRGCGPLFEHPQSSGHIHMSGTE